jgi:hypothetical protein
VMKTFREWSARSTDHGIERLYLDATQLARRCAHGPAGFSSRLAQVSFSRVLSLVTYEIPEVTELRVSVPKVCGRLLPLPVAAWHG